MPQREPQRRRERYSAFLNIPYDSAFENLYLAYIAGLSAFGLIPRATVEIPTSQRRLERILNLIQECAYSIHDLSRVQLDVKAPRVPRFNMPFELGLAVAQNVRQPAGGMVRLRDCANEASWRQSPIRSTSFEISSSPRGRPSWTGSRGSKGRS